MKSWPSWPGGSEQLTVVSYQKTVSRLAPRVLPFSKLTNTTIALWASAGSYVGGLLTPTIRLGVTGLARSGKTVFITALIRNLLEGGRLPFFTAAAQGRILRAYLEPQPDDEVPRFAYEDHLAVLGADPPQWPVSTTALSQLRITVEYETGSLLHRTLGSNMLHIDIVDYPGEWLIDLPLLEMSYDAWARDALALARQPARARHAAAFFAFLRDLPSSSDPAGQSASPAAVEQIARTGAALFTQYLNEARADDHALSIAGPGRFLMPGDLTGSPLLTFFPLAPQQSRATPSQPADGTGETSALAGDRQGRGRAAAADLSSLLARRYQSYKSHVVKPFFRNHFVRLDRQIVLVDALAALNAGPAALTDLQAALQKILTCFRPGSNSWLTAILFRRIDRLLFAATKADHLHHSSHDRLEAVLAQLTNDALKRARLSGAAVKVMALAALRATTEVDVRQKGETLHCIKGVPLPGEKLGAQTFNGTTPVVIFPGDLPADPGKAIMQGRKHVTGEAEELRFIRFRPPRLPDPASHFGSVPWPHIRLDRALEFLIGDRLQ